MAEKKKQKSDFLYDDNNQSSEELKISSSAIQPRMLPPFFREKTRFLQKIYLFLIIVAVAFSISVTVFVMLDDFTQKSNITTSTQITFLICSLFLCFITILAGIFFTWWSRVRTHLLTLPQVLFTLISPLVFIITLIYLDVSSSSRSATDASTTKFVFLIIGVTNFGGAIVTGLGMLSFNIIRTRTYREAKLRSVFIVPGYLLLSAAPLILWERGGELNYQIFTLDGFMYSIIAMFGGAICMAIGVIFSYKYRAHDAKHASVIIRLSGSLPSLVIAVVLTSVAIRGLAFESKETSVIIYLPVIINALIDLFIICGFLGFLFFRARVKNMVNTNPLFNEFIIKGFLIVTFLFGIAFVVLLPTMAERAKSFSQMSFAILLSTGLTAFIIISMSHFMNLIVFEKFLKVMIGITTVVGLITLVIVFTLGTINSSAIIIQVAARAIVLVHLVAAVLGEIILTMLDIFVVQRDIYKISAKKRQGAKAKKQSDDTLMDEMEGRLA